VVEARAELPEDGADSVLFGMPGGVAGELLVWVKNDKVDRFVEVAGHG
jgi:hypothetical protein